MSLYAHAEAESARAAGCGWHLPPPLPTLSRDEVHVWRAKLDTPPSAVAPLEALLASDERARADRFIFPNDRRRFVVGRAILRSIVGLYLGRAPSTVAFSYGSHGKPRLSEAAIAEGLSFNVSHSDDTALYAFADARELGIDIERLDRKVDVAGIAGQFFAPGEVAAIAAMPAERQHLRFFDFWTRKEAYVKALGQGLSIPLNEFDVSSIGRTPRADHGNGLDSTAWSIRELQPGTGYAAALVVSGRPYRLACWDWR
jgi:4'-phosphopantetheinyl transferase